MKKLTVLTIFAVIVSVLLTACTFGTYSVTLDYGYGEPTVTTVDGGSVFILPEAERDGYDFLGWKSEGGYRMMQAGEKVTVTSDVTYKAYWVIEGGLPEPPPETVKIVLKDGDEVVATETVMKGAEFVVPDCDVIHEGKDFAGWSSEDLNYNPGDKFVADKNCVLTAQWADKILTVTFKDGNSVYKTEEITYGSELTVPECDAEHLGKRFSGWKLGEVAYNAGNKLIVKENCEFSAVWVDIEYIIRFIDNDGTVLKTETLLYGDMPTAPEAGDKTESETTVLVFSGWDAEIVAVTANKDYTATYIPTTRYYPVSFLGGDFVRFTDTEGAEITEISREYNEPYYFCVVKNAGVDISGMRVSIDGVEVSAQDGIYTAVFSENTVVSVEGAVKIEYFLNFNSENATYTAEMPDEVVYGSTVKVLARGNEWYEDAAPAVTYAGSEIVSCGTEVADDVTYFVYEITVTRNGVILISGVEDVIPVTFVDINNDEIVLEWTVSYGWIGKLDGLLNNNIAVTNRSDGNEYLIYNNYYFGILNGTALAITDLELDSYVVDDASEYFLRYDTENIEDLYPVKGGDNVYHYLYFFGQAYIYGVGCTAPEGYSDFAYYYDGAGEWNENFVVSEGVNKLSVDGIDVKGFSVGTEVYIKFTLTGGTDEYPVLKDYTTGINVEPEYYEILGENVLCYKITVNSDSNEYLCGSPKAKYTFTLDEQHAKVVWSTRPAAEVTEGGSVFMQFQAWYSMLNVTDIDEYIDNSGSVPVIKEGMKPFEATAEDGSDVQFDYTITPLGTFAYTIAITVSGIDSNITMKFNFAALGLEIPYTVTEGYTLYADGKPVDGEIGSVINVSLYTSGNYELRANEGFMFVSDGDPQFVIDRDGSGSVVTGTITLIDATVARLNTALAASEVYVAQGFSVSGLVAVKYTSLVSHDEFNCATSDTLNGITYVEEPKAYIGEDGVFSFKVKLPYGNTPVLYVEYASRPSDGSVKYYPVEISHEGTVTSTFTFTVSGVDSDIGWFIKLVPNVYEVTVNYGDVTEVIELAHGTELEGCDLLPEYFEGYKDDVAGKFTVIGWATREDAAEPDIISVSGPVTIWAVTEFEPYV